MKSLKAVSMGRLGMITGKRFHSIYYKLKQKMRFSKKHNIYKIIRVTGNRDNILGICFGDKDITQNNIEIIEWNFPNVRNSSNANIRTSKTDILNQVLEGLNSINEALGTNYTLSKIYYEPYEDSSCFIYRTLIRSLIVHYYEGKEFKEV